MEALLAVKIASSILRACDFGFEIVSDLRTCPGSFQRLEVERSNLSIEIDRLTELNATISDSIQKVRDTLKEWQVLEDTMTETILAAGQVFSLLERSSPAGGLQRISATASEPSERRELQRSVDKVEICILSLREAASAVMERYSKPDRLPDKTPRGRPRRSPRPVPTNKPLQPRPSFVEWLGNENWSSQEREDGNNVGPGSEDVSKLARCGLVVTTVAGSLVTTAWDLRPDMPTSFMSRSCVEKLGLQIVDIPSMVSVLRSPATLVCATATTAMALTAYHYLQRGRKHQDAYIAGAVAAGVTGGWLYELDGTSILLRVTPWCALLGILMGACSPMRQRQDHGPDEISGNFQISKPAVSFA